MTIICKHSVFLLIVTTLLSLQLFAQSSCGGHVYQLKNTDIPKGFEFVKSYSIDDKQGSKQVTQYTYVGKSKEMICLTIRGHCAKSQNIQLSILDIDGKVLLSNVGKKGLKDCVYFEPPKSGIYYFCFSFVNKAKCRNCGDAILSRKKKKS